MKDKRKWKLLLFVSALLLPYFALCFFAHPIGDDFSPAILSVSITKWFNIFYNTWGGRYTAIVLTWIFGSRSLDVYRIVAAAILVLTVSSSWFLITSFIGKALSFFEKLTGAIFFTALLLSMLPSLPQAIYWENGSLTYQLGNISAMFYTGLVAGLMQEKYIVNRFVHTLICIVVLFITAGFNETLMFILLAAHFVLLKIGSKQKNIKPFAVILFVSLSLFSMIVLLAPGNITRGQFYQGTHQLANSLSMSALQMVRFFFSWVFYAPLWAATILFVAISNRLYESSLAFRWLAALKWWQVFLFLWLILFLCTFPAYWNTGILGQHRTLNVACACFLPTWFLLAFIVAKKMGLNEKAEFLTAKAKRLIVVLLAGLLFFSGNSGMALLEFGKGEISGFNNEMNMRDRLVREARQEGKKEVSVPPLINQPTSLFVLDLQTDCKHWINTSYAQYMGIDTVRLQPPLNLPR